MYSSNHPSTHLLCQQSGEILFSHFMTTLNAAFESKLAMEDKGYGSGSKNFNIPTPLRRTSKIHHVSSVKNASFDPDPVTLCSTCTRESHCRPITYSSSEVDDGTSIDETPSLDSTLASAAPCRCFSVTIFQIHPECIH